MRTAVLALLLVAAFLGACSAATTPATPSIVGRYVRERVRAIDSPDWRGIVGQWSAEYRADGHLIVHGANGMEVDSLYRVDGDVLTLTDLSGSGSCRVSGIDFAAGRYRIERDGDEIRFHVLRDECGGRRSVLLSHPLRRVR